MSCEETRQHLESCEDCHLYVVVEARLRTQPVLAPPKGFASKVMKALPRTVPVKREMVRLAAAALLLLGMTSVFVGLGLDRHETLEGPRQAITDTIQATIATVSNQLGSVPWKR